MLRRKLMTLWQTHKKSKASLVCPTATPGTRRASRPSSCRETAPSERFQHSRLRSRRQLLRRTPHARFALSAPTSEASPALALSPNFERPAARFARSLSSPLASRRAIALATEQQRRRAVGCLLHVVHCDSLDQRDRERRTRSKPSVGRCGSPFAPSRAVLRSACRSAALATVSTKGEP
jgi:hypothetical protein